jgi:hypothetical protein
MPRFRQGQASLLLFEIALCSCVSRRQKGNLGYLAIIRRCAIVEAEFQIVAAVGLPSKKA